MSVRLLVKQRGEGSESPQVVDLDDEVITVGRDKTCQLVLAQQAVSRTHARISRDGPLFFIEDLGSSYGTRINGQRLPKGEKRLLRNGDTIAIAQFDLVFDRATETAKPKPGESTSLVSRQAVKDALRGLSTDGPYFRVMNGPKEGQRIEVADAQEIVVGRDDDADLQLKDDLVSRKHAKIRRDWSGTHVEDLGSRNGIKVNKKRVSRKTLKDRDELEIGGIRLLYLDPSEVREGPAMEEGEATAQETDDKPAEKPAPPTPEPEPEAAPAEEPAAAAAPSEPEPEPEPAPPPADESAAPATNEEPPAEEPLPEEPVAEGPAGGFVTKFAAFAGVSRSKAIIPLIAMGVFAILAIVVIIAIVAGA